MIAAARHAGSAQPAPAGAPLAGRSIVVATAGRRHRTRKRTHLSRPRKGLFHKRKDPTRRPFAALSYHGNVTRPEGPARLAAQRLVTGSPTAALLLDSQVPAPSISAQETGKGLRAWPHGIPSQEYSQRWPQPAGQWELPSSHFMMCCRWPPWLQPWHHTNRPLTTWWQTAHMLAQRWHLRTGEWLSCGILAT